MRDLFLLSEVERARVWSAQRAGGTGVIGVMIPRPAQWLCVGCGAYSMLLFVLFANPDPTPVIYSTPGPAPPPLSASAQHVRSDGGVPDFVAGVIAG